MSAEDATQIVGGIGIALLLLVSFIAMMSQQSKLEDPDDIEVVELGQLIDVAELTEGFDYTLRTIRQSGNLQKEDQYFSCPRRAIEAGVTTFRRAKIPYVVIDINNSSEISFRRPFHSHRGVNEGKKVGKIEIYRSS